MTGDKKLMAHVLIGTLVIRSMNNLIAVVVPCGTV